MPCRGGFPGFPFVLYSAKEGDFMAFDKKAYDMDYAKQNITRKHIPFNLTNKEDADLLAWLNKQGNVTQYVKRLIREDIARIGCQNGCQIEKATAGTPEE
jgi:cation diffusion facilitator CzcD-associated flavoprotein CzcO